MERSFPGLLGVEAVKIIALNERKIKMKISKQQLQKLIKEAIQKQLNEGGNERFEKLDRLREFMSDTDILEELVRYLSDSEWDDHFKTMMQYHGGDPDYGVGSDMDYGFSSRSRNEQV